MAALAVLVLATLGGVVRCGFIPYDDGVYVASNPHVQAGLTWDGIGWAATTLHAGLWIPLTWISLMTDTQVFGTALWGHHATNLGLHLVATLLLFGWLLRTTVRLLPSFVVAALFGVHPLHVESVASVAECKDVLSTVLLMATLWANSAWAEAPSRLRWAAVLVAFGLALLAMPMLATVPVVLLLIDVWPLQRAVAGRAAALWEKLPLFAASVLVTIVTIVAQQRAGGVAPLSALPMSERIATAATGYVWYLAKPVWPTNLALLYPYDHAIPLWQTAGSIVLLAGISAAAAVAGRRRPYLLVGWLWFLVMLLPVCGLVQNGVQRYADRFAYVPQIGLFLALVWGAADACARWRVPAPALAVGTAGVLLAYSVASRAQVATWRDGVSVFERTVAVTRDNASAHVLLGLAWAERGDVARAQAEYERALAIDPQHAGARGELTALAVRIQRDEAQRSVAAGDAGAAVAALEKAVRMAPANAGLRSDLGNALAMGGRLPDAVAAYREALRLDPGDPHTHMNLANALYLGGQPSVALGEYERALQLDPQYAEAHFNLGVVLAEQGRREAAVGHWREAARLGYQDAVQRLRDAGG